MRHAVILAGGSGTRLWPASRRARPKQLLSIGDDGETMIGRAVGLARKIAGVRVLVVTTEDQVEATREVIPDVEIISEPVGRNTAAAIGLAGAVIDRRDPKATLAILPADHHIRDRDGMAAAIDGCLDEVEKTDVIALIGIPPTRPDTGFGYLETAKDSTESLRPVLCFVEKPSYETALGYLRSGRHLWNAGIFCLSARRLLSDLETHLPATAHVVLQMTGEEKRVSRGLYETLPSISFDHAVMEKTDRVVVVPAAVGWSDVGSWAAIAEVRGVSDEAGNTISGEAVIVDGTGNVVMSDDDTLIATIGVSDLVVVKSGNAIVIVPKAQAQRVREIVEKLSTTDRTRYL